MSETREQIIERMAQATAYPSSIAGVPVIIVDNRMRDEAAKMLPVAVKAVTDRVREMHHVNANGLSCASCGEDYPCRTVLLLDQIDTEMGCQP